MTPTASPRHPWKALAVVIAMFATVHGVRAHTGWHDHAIAHVQVADSSDDDNDNDDDADTDCPHIDVRIQDGTVRINGHDITDDRDEDAPVIDVFDGAEWS